MAAVNAYLNFLGNTEEVFNFYKSVFGTEFSVFQRFSDTPYGAQMPEADRNKIMHLTLPIGKGTVLMASDAMDSNGTKFTVGDNMSLAVAAESEDEANQIFAGLSEGGVIKMPLQKTFWGAYFGMCNDKFGIQWMVNYDYPKEA